MERLPAVSLCRFGFEVVPDADVARALDAQVVDARRNAGPHSTGLEVKILAVFR